MMFQHELGWLIDPLTGRRYLPEGYIYIGGANNVETPMKLDEFIEELNINWRDLRSRLLLLKQRVDYVLNSQLIIPFENKYIKNAQVLSKLQPALLKHKNGIISEAISGKDYVDVKNVQNGKFALIEVTATPEKNKFIQVSKYGPDDIKNEINVTIDNSKTEIINEVTQEITQNVEKTVKNHTTKIVFDFSSHFNNVSKFITEFETNLNNTIQLINNINNNINTTTELQTQLQEIINNYNNITQEIEIGRASCRERV